MEVASYGSGFFAAICSIIAPILIIVAAQNEDKQSSMTVYDREGKPVTLEQDLHYLKSTLEPDIVRSIITDIVVVTVFIIANLVSFPRAVFLVGLSVLLVYRVYRGIAKRFSFAQALTDLYNFLFWLVFIFVYGVTFFIIWTVVLTTATILLGKFTLSIMKNFLDESSKSP